MEAAAPAMLAPSSLGRRHASAALLLPRRSQAPKASSPVIPPFTSHVGACHRRRHHPRSTPEIVTGTATSSAIHVPRQSSSPAAVSSSATPHAGLIASGRVLHCPCPTPELIAEAASSTVHTPTSSSVRIGAVTGGSDEQATTTTMKPSSCRLAADSPCTYSLSCRLAPPGVVNAPHHLAGAKQQQQQESCISNSSHRSRVTTI
uniref:Uncharacterized protein n=1 Tax=Oryza sativa subsp. japonica TaxID=39947 RepID=Q6ESG2_ORYSJ|nr:hypothetical protein [Oryza sativa Japonica Group]